MSRGVKHNDPVKLKAYDVCQTPGYALGPILIQLMKNFGSVWESAAGEGNLVKALEYNTFHVIGTDIRRLQSRDFFDWTPDKAKWDVQVTNPPWSLKYKWLKRSYEIGKPFALLVPVKILGGKAAQELFAKYGYEWVFLNRRVNFKTPDKGYEGHGATFPVMWVCKHVMDKPVTFANLRIFAHSWEKDLARTLK